ncbi:MAG: DEAD/DEAH box helicase [Planctomycetes bacterium]|nr:DEAD/DEAH box helicase [Planctomycetota bacterium]
MSAFERLDPALQHHIVNSLGWRQLRPLQEAAIEPLLAGDHALLLAPTAGGKTEAAVFPLFSRMLAEHWSGLSILYVCPIKALLNNLEPRLARYAGLVGRRVARWHGDVTAGAKFEIAREPPDVLLTTPESLEGLLVSRRFDRATLFRNVRAVVVDELHAFAGDSRGWHLLAVLSRIQRIAGASLQRVGLSATVGNAEELLQWLVAGNRGRGRVVAPAAATPLPPEVGVDHVGSVANAALVISRLHRGEKRLVFVDSRARTEQLAAELRVLGVRTFVSHSSLSAEERRRAEEAFAQEQDCVIVATSTLELGIDVGDLDRVLQLDAPGTVASFLQRIGRTGRRSGSRRNCLFLTTSDESFLAALGLLRLWSEGYVEPIVPPAEPLHVLAQQWMALVLQEGGLPFDRWREWLDGVAGLRDLDPGKVGAVWSHMLDRQILIESDGLVSFGPEGERSFGYRHFLELMSVFSTPPLFKVLHGRVEVGQVHSTTFLLPTKGERALVLAGRYWKVAHLDWGRRIAFVEPTDARGRSNWLGRSAPMTFALAQAIRRGLTQPPEAVQWSRRALEELEKLRQELSFLEEGGSVLERTVGGSARWWTFGGRLVNTALAAALGVGEESPPRAEDLFVEFELAKGGAGTIVGRLQRLSELPDAAFAVPIDDEALDGLKFSVCLPPAIARAMLSQWSTDRAAIRAVLSGGTRGIES